MNNLMKKAIAECLGTFVLVMIACGTAVVTNVNVVATALAFGLAVVAMAYAIGDISGCHINPAVSIAMLINKKISVKEFLVYVLSQLIGATVGAIILWFIFGQRHTLGANQMQAIIIDGHDNNAVKYLVALVTEIILTFIFVYVICVVTSKRENSKIAGLIIGLTLVLVHLIGIGLTGTSVNPARSFGPAIFEGGEALKQLWIFIVGPLLGGALAAFVYRFLNDYREEI